MRRSYGIVGVVALVGISIFFVRAPIATSDPDVDDAAAPVESDPAYFQLTATGEGAIPYDELSPEEQDVVERAAERMETEGNSGAELAELTRQAGEKARAHAAAMSVGLEGLDSEGVVP